MSTPPIIYITHPNTGELVGTALPDPDPLDLSNWLIPAHAFLDVPPNAGAHQAVVRLNDEWQLLPDYRGHVYYTADGLKHEISELGIEPPQGALDQPPPPSAEGQAKVARAEWLRERAKKVEAIKVKTKAGFTYNGGEDSQGRMARAIIGLQSQPGRTMTWVLADNSTHEVDAAELTEALILAGEEQERIWVAGAVI